MFTRSRRELETEQVLGHTTAFGVRLLNRKHPHPVLVETEEKYHGAFLANTTHGALYRALASIDLEPSPLALILPLNRQIRNVKGLLVDIQFRRDEVLRAGIPTHETFAKYIAFNCDSALPDEDKVGLQSYYEQDCERYHFIRTLHDIVGDPLQGEASAEHYHGERRFRHETAYMAGKLILNTLELDNVLRFHSPSALQRTFSVGTFWDKYRPNERMEAVLRILRDAPLKELWQKYRDIAPANLLFGTGYAEKLYEFILSRLTSVGIASSKMRRPSTLAALSALLGERLQRIAPGLYHHLRVPIGWQHSKDRTDIDGGFLEPDGEFIPQGSIAMSLMVDNDPSMTVFYDHGTNERKQWERHLDQSEIPKHQLSGETVTYLTADESSNLDLYVVTRESAPINGPLVYEVWEQTGRCRLVRFREAQALFSFLKQFVPSRLSIVLIPPRISSPAITQDPCIAFASTLSNLGSIVFWNLGGTLSTIIREKSFLYIDQRDCIRPDQLGAFGAMFPCYRPLGLLVVDDGFAVMSSIPQYTAELLRHTEAAQSADLIPRPTFISRSLRSGEVVHLDSGDRVLDPRLTGAVRAYECIYASDTLPDLLPLNDPWLLYERLMVLSEAEERTHDRR